MSPQDLIPYLGWLIGGGFVLGAAGIFAAVHNIQAGVPPENIVAMFDAAMAAGRYG